MRSTRGLTSTSPPGDSFWLICGSTSGSVHAARTSTLIASWTLMAYQMLKLNIEEADFCCLMCGEEYHDYGAA